MLVKNPTTWFQDILNNLLKLVIWPVFFAASIIMLIFAGFMFVTAQGDPAKITTARKAVVWAIIGIIVAILAFSIPGILKDIIPTP